MGLIWLFLIALLIITAACTAALVWRISHPPRKTLAAALACGDPTDPADLELQARTLTLHPAPGIETVGWLIEGERPDGPLVVMLHGFGDSRYGSLARAPLATPYASHVLVYDQRAQGDCTCPFCGGGVAEADDVLAIVDQLDLPADTPVVLFGSSMGGTTAIAAAAKAFAEQLPVASRLQGVIADGPYRFWDEPIRSVFRDARYPTWPTIPLAGLVLRLLRPDRVGFDRARDAGTLPCPLLVLHGDADEICPFEAGEAIAAAAPRGTLAAFEGGHHLDLLETDEPRYLAAIDAFFTQLAGPAPADAPEPKEA